jgi:opacity protein-like surface antigen
MTAVVIHAASAGAAHAQTINQGRSSSNGPSAQMTPFFALGDDLAPGGGAAFTFPWTRQLSVEAEASLGRDAARSSLSLLYALPQWGRFAIYVAGGAGVQRDEVDMANEPFLRSDPSFARRKTEFAVNVGAGVSLPVTERWAYRADFRWYNPKAEWPESWRAFSGLTVAMGR